MGNTNCSPAGQYDPMPICCAGGSGIFLAGGGSPFWDYSNSSSVATSVFYLFLLLWLFIGVALAADVFMAAIETITSTLTVVKNIMPGNAAQFSPRRSRAKQ